MSSKWIVRELAAGIDHGLKVLPVLLRPTPISTLPLSLQRIQWADITRYPPSTAASSVAEEIVRALSDPTVEESPASLPQTEREGLAKAFATQTSGQDRPTEDEEKPPNSVFIVHGHDDEFLHDVVTFVRSLDVTPIVMKEVGGAATSLIGRFFEIGGAAKFAIVLLSADDMGLPDCSTKRPALAIRH